MAGIEGARAAWKVKELLEGIGVGGGRCYAGQGGGQGAVGRWEALQRPASTQPCLTSRPKLCARKRGKQKARASLRFYLSKWVKRGAGWLRDV